MTPLALFVALAVAAPAAQIPSVASLSPQGEAGAPLVITGTILAGNGAPAAGVTMSLYQADVSGIYCDERCPPGKQARLAASLVTGSDGHYEIRTIRPGSYPGQRIPAHIHVKLSCEGCRDQVPDEFRFADDPFISDNERSEPERLGRFASVMAVTRGADGTWKATRDIKMTGK